MNFLIVLQDQGDDSILEIVNTFIGHTIWPITILLIFLVFRKQIVRKMDKLNSIDASSTGISMSFEQELDGAIEEMLEEEEQPKLVAKSGVKIGDESKLDKPKSPVANLLELRDKLNQKILKKADSAGVDSSGKSLAQLLDVLETNNDITSKEHKNWSRLVHLTNAVDQNITMAQVNKVKLLFNSYSKEL